GGKQQEGVDPESGRHRLQLFERGRGQNQHGSNPLRRAGSALQSDLQTRCALTRFSQTRGVRSATRSLWFSNASLRRDAGPLTLTPMIEDARPQLKKPSFPVSEGLRRYLRRYRRERSLPVTYARLRGFEESCPL